MASADAVCDWNMKAGEIVVTAKMGPPPANRAMAIANTAVYEAVNAITKRYPAGALKLDVTPGASVDAAIAAAHRTALAKLLPSQQSAIDSVYRTALSKVPDGQAKTSGIAVGEQAAAAILAMRADDGAAAAETYRPQTAAGVYVPTMIPAVTHWPQRKPWLMTSSSQFRPGPPPALTSALWARDFNEVKALGGKSNSRRTTEQTQIASFWEATLPAIYDGIVLSIANVPGRDVTQNARLFAAVAQAADDALTSVFDAKYHYNFWRPVTAIRNGDLDGNDATERDASWTPFIDTPMHPEYPCAHCTVAAAVGTVLQAEIGTGAMPALTTTSYLLKGPARNWKTIDDFMQEVGNARVYDGVHFRNSTEVGTAMGKQVGALAVTNFLQRSD
ncbi:MAG TPA: vanadium-dependent haloperoxidase [Burkholderiaceae bacterium]|nr:vanadium-dependent haloperoxidase [Burkholderiaceae bacterium]